jgi:hypothetical protein
MLYLTQDTKDRKEFQREDCWEPPSWDPGWSASDLASTSPTDLAEDHPASSAQMGPDEPAAVCATCGCPVRWSDADGRLDCWACSPPPLPAFVVGAFLVVEKTDSSAKLSWLPATDAILACSRQTKRRNPSATAADEVSEIVRYAKQAGAAVPA